MLKPGVATGVFGRFLQRLLDKLFIGNPDGRRVGRGGGQRVQTFF
jgi:hypothetical protein